MLKFDHTETTWPYVVISSRGLWSTTDAFSMEPFNDGTGAEFWALTLESQLNEQVILRKLRINYNLAPIAFRPDSVNWQVYLERVAHTGSESGTALQGNAELFDEGEILNSVEGGNYSLIIDLDRRHTNTGTGFNFRIDLFTPIGVDFSTSPMNIMSTDYLIEGIPVSWMASRADNVTIVDAIPVDWPS
jgi:hypothetical protein